MNTLKTLSLSTLLNGSCGLLSYLIGIEGSIGGEPSSGAALALCMYILLTIGVSSSFFCALISEK